MSREIVSDKGVRTCLRIKKENDYVSISENLCEQKKKKKTREDRNVAKKQNRERKREKITSLIKGSRNFLISSNGMPPVKQFSFKPQQRYYKEEILPWKIDRLCFPG